MHATACGETFGVGSIIKSVLIQNTFLFPNTRSVLFIILRRKPRGCLDRARSVRQSVSSPDCVQSIIYTCVVCMLELMDGCIKA